MPSRKQPLKNITEKFGINENSFIAKYLSNPRLVILVLLLVVIIGVFSLLTLPRTLNPEIKIPIVVISTVLPGANPEDVESLITIPIEDSVRGIQRIDTLQSTSQDSVSIITMQFQSGVDPDKAKQDVQSAVDTVTTLPKDAQRPNVQKLDFENQPVWTFDITGNDEASLFRLAHDLDSKLENLPEIDKVEISGLEDTEVQVTLKPEAISTYKINPILIQPLIANSLKSFPAGSVRTQNSTFALTIDPQVVTIDDIRNLKISLDGQIVALSQIALISEHPKPDQAQSFLTYPGCNNTHTESFIDKTSRQIKSLFGIKKAESICDDGQIKRAITFNVFRVTTVNIDTAVAAAHKLVDEQLKNKGETFQQVNLIDTADEINSQYFDLTRDFLITIFLVVVVLFIFLGSRQAIVSAFSAPLSFLIVFSVMKTSGITLNFLSLFSLILSLGLLVDDTVVVISAMTAYWRKYRLSPLQTALLVWKDFLIPIFTTTITTIFAFLPLLIASGIIGEFIKSIPVVVSTALAASFFVSIFITLPLIIILLKPQIPHRVNVFLKFLLFLGAVAVFYLIIPKDNSLVMLQILLFLVVLLVGNLVRGQLWKKSTAKLSRTNTASSKWGRRLDEGFLSFSVIETDYKKLIERIVTNSGSRRTALIMVVIFFIFSVLLVPLGFVKNEFFPKTDTDLVYINVELPAGTYVTETKAEATDILQTLRETPHLEFATADIGRSYSADAGGGAGGGTNTVLFTVRLVNKSSIEVADYLRNKFSGYQKGDLSVQELSGGPPAGSDLQLKLQGDDLTVLENYADTTIEYLKTQPGVTNVKKSIKPGTSKITFVPDQTAISQNNLSVDQIGLWLRTYASGFSLDKIRLEGDKDKKDITFRLSPSTAFSSDINSLVMPTLTGNNVAISSLGKLTLEPNPTLITRESGERTVSVTAGVTAGFNTQEINAKLEKFADDQLKLPTGYTWKTGGVNEENQKSVNSILQAMILSFLLIIITMVIQFASFRRALIVMLVIPLAASGVFIVFALTGTPLSFPALIGILALFGIVVKNSILIVDRIVENEKRGMSLGESIGEASASRLEPIALTTFCTMIGLVPITLSDPLWRGLGGAIISGLLFSGTVMLFFIPVVYYYLFRDKSSSV